MMFTGVLLMSAGLQDIATLFMALCLMGRPASCTKGFLDLPTQAVFWDVVEKYGVNIFYTAPTAIRAFIKMGEEIPNARNLSSLRLLGTVGEPINSRSMDVVSASDWWRSLSHCRYLVADGNGRHYDDSLTGSDSD